MLGNWFNSSIDVLMLVFIIAAVAIGIFYYLNRWAAKKMSDQNSMIERTRQTVSIYVIDKKKAKPKDANFPKAVIEQIPKYYSFLKMPLVKAKVGPQIMTLMCDKRVFNALQVKKTVKVDIAGIYIVDMKGLKSEKEMKEIAKAKKVEAKKSEAKKSEAKKAGAEKK